MLAITFSPCVFPAPAGVILELGQDWAIVRSFPRTCGGDPILETKTQCGYLVFPAPAGVILFFS